MVPPGNNTGNPAKPMSYNNAYKKMENYLGNMLRGLMQRIRKLLITLAAVSELKRQPDAYRTVISFRYQHHIQS